MIIALLSTVFLASLVGSLHCAGMCGGIVALCVNGREIGASRPISRWQPHTAYNAGRLITYACLGAVSGLIGSAIDLGGSAIGLTQVALTMAGVAMILFGSITLLRIGGVRFGCTKLPPFLAQRVQQCIVAANRFPPTRRSFAIGALTGFLPCGWLYAFVVAAAGTGSAQMGAMTMAAFWAGTVPVLLGLGLGAQAAVGAFRRHVPIASAVALIVVGSVFVLGRVSVPSYAAAIDAQMAERSNEDGPASVHQQVRGINSITLPCCQMSPDEKGSQP